METTRRFLPLLEPIRPQMEQVERVLYERLSPVDGWLDFGLRRLLSGGKRLRPALVILAGEVFSPSDEGFYRLGAAVEMLHMATLIHDDLVDGSPLRRGHTTLHTAWPARVTVLTGDYLLAQSASLISELDRPRILKGFAEALCAMCAGEIRQIIVMDGRPRSREEYYRCIGAKTASLCAAATEMAGILAGAEEPHVAALRRFGWELGTAFQIVDDVLDFVGDEARLGKPAGNDLRQGLATLPALCYLEVVADVADGNPVGAVLAGRHDEGQIEAAVEVVRASGAIEAALAEARVHVGQGQEALLHLPDGAARRLLWSLAAYVVERKR